MPQTWQKEHFNSGDEFKGGIGVPECLQLVKTVFLKCQQKKLYNLKKENWYIFSRQFLQTEWLLWII